MYIINKSLFQCLNRSLFPRQTFEHLLRFLSRDQGPESSRFLCLAATVIKKEEQSPFWTIGMGPSRQKANIKQAR